MTKNGANVLMVKPVGKKSKKLIGSPNPGWGLHHGHKPALGDLIDLVRSQKKAYASAKARSGAPSALWLPVGSEADSGPFRVEAGQHCATCGARHSILVSSVTRKCV